MTDLVGALALLDRRARAYTVTAWRARGRAAIAFGLAATFVELARQAGDRVPAEVVLPDVGEHGIADVLAVLGQDLLAAQPNAEIAAAAVDAINAALDAFAATTVL